MERIVAYEDVCSDYLNGIPLVTETRTLADPYSGKEIGISKTWYPEEDGVPLALRGLVVLETDSNGAVAEHDIQVGDFDSTAFAFVPSAGGKFLRTVTRRRMPNAEHVAPAVSEIEICDAAFGRLLWSWKETEDGTRFGTLARVYDSQGRLRSETRSDGCVATNDYSCCRLLSKTDFNGKKTLRSATTGQDRLYYAAEEISFAELPGAEGFPVTQHFFDALGRETATVVRASCNLPGAFVNPHADAFCDLPEQRTSVIYPEGDSAHFKTVRPTGIVAETWLEKTSAWEREIVAECGVTNTIVRWRNGKETQTKQWSGNWLKTTRQNIWQDGSRFEVELVEGSDFAGVVTNSCIEFDLLGRAVAVATPLGVTTNFYEEGTAKLVRSVSPDGIATEYEYDTAGNVALNRNAQTQLSNKEETAFETVDGILREVRINTTQSASGALRMNGVSVSRLTGLSSNVVAETENVLASGEKISRRESLFAVEEKSSLAETSSVQSNLFGKTVFKSNLAGASFTRYDALARPKEIAFVLPGGTTNAVRKIAYDAVGNVVTSCTEYADGIAAEETFVYDLRGNVLAKRDAEGNVVTNSYDELNRLVQTGGATLPAKYGYDTRGRRVLLATTRDGSAWDETRWFFDDANFVTNKFYADGASQKYVRNAAGKVSLAVNARGDEIVYYYDEAGRLQEKSGANGYEILGAEFEYDEWGNVARERNLYDYYEYQRRCDDFGHLTNETAVLYGKDLSEVRRRLDCSGRITELSVNGNEVFYGYDCENRIATVSNCAFAVEYMYTQDGRDAGYVLRTADGMVLRRDVVCDSWRRELARAITNYVNGVAVESYSLSHDLLGRATNINGVAYSYDKYSQLVADALQSYAWDDAGNLNNDCAASALNQRTDLQYDADGNVLALDGIEFELDGENRPTAILVPREDSFWYLCPVRDASGRTILEDCYDADDFDKQEVRFHRIYDGWNIVKENNGGDEREYVWGKDISGTIQGAGGVGGLLAVKKNGSWYYPLYDHNGNITKYIAQDGSVAATYSYKSFGENTTTDPADFRHHFSTKWQHPETGLIDFGLRDYSPSIATWLSRDPVGENAGLNLHAFCGNDPVNRYDYLGKAASITWKIEYGWSYSTEWNEVPESSMDRSAVRVLVSYMMSEEERKCCNRIEIVRYVRKLPWIGGNRYGTYKLDHSAECSPAYDVGGYPLAFAEDDAPDGISILGKLFLPWTQSFKWEAKCISGKKSGTILSTLELQYSTSLHWDVKKYRGVFNVQQEN